MRFFPTSATHFFPNAQQIIGSPFHLLIEPFYPNVGFPKNFSDCTSVAQHFPDQIIINDISYYLRFIDAGENECLATLTPIPKSPPNNTALIDCQKKFDEIIQSISDVYYTTTNGRIINTVSPTIEPMCGLAPAELIGKSTDDFFKTDKSEKIYKELENTGQVSDARLIFKLPDNQCKTLSFTIYAKRDESNQILSTSGLVKDITNQDRFERELIKSESKFREIFQSISDIYYRSDKDGVVQVVSPSVEEISGFKPEEVLNKDQKIFFKSPETSDAFREILKEKGSIRNMHGELLKKDKTPFYVSITARANYDSKGNFNGSNGIIRDITKEKKHNKLTKLHKDILEKVAKENDLSEIFNFTCLGVENIISGVMASILLLDPNLNVLVHGTAPSLPDRYNQQVNNLPIGPAQGSCGTAAFTRQTVIVSDIANDPLWTSVSDLALREGLKACWSVPILSVKQKVLGTFAMYYKTVRHPKKEELDLIHNMANILSLAIENHNNRKDLISSEKRYRQLVNNSPVAILIHTDGIIKFVNKEAMRIVLATHKNDLLGKNVIDFVVESDRSMVQKRQQEVAQNKTAPQIEEQFIRLDGSTIDVEVMGSFITYQNKPSTQLVFYDISARKALEREQNKLNDFLIKQNKQLEEFAQIASHNLRAPIANIFSLMNLYEMDQSIENTQFVLEQLKITSTNLHETINELTEVIKTSWELNKKQQPLRFSATLKKVKQEVSNEIIKKNALITENFEQIDHIVYPKVYLESILQNLLSNALKYNHPDRPLLIHISTKVKDGQVFLVVKDNGLGIDLKKHGNKLFGLRKTFHHNENARGVGLFITKAQVESMGGEILVNSEINAGSEFIVNFGSSRYMKEETTNDKNSDHR